ncbi:MAG: sugar phosphate isomerase/epimerase and 4-hydroxyphenylpyruvate domain-containing protein [Chloroflexi bacterium]|nr:sugar phosphate isomerase/epimerase and 4-hydroxyphenylpyruvate domain-containing protein [Chloroflexota bacterium]
MQVGIASSIWRGIADLPFPEYLAWARQSGAETIEVSAWPTSYGSTLALDAASAPAVRAQAAAAGLDIVAVGAFDDLAQADEADWQEQVALVRRLIDVTARLGAPVLSLKVGSPKEGLERDAAIGRIIAGLRAVADEATARHVFLGLENRSTITNDVDTLLSILEACNSSHVKVLLDTGNLRQFGYTPVEVTRACERLAPYVIHSHLKDAVGAKREFRPAALGQGELDLDGILTVLRRAGYRRPLCVQYEGPDQERTYGQDVAFVRARIDGWDEEAERYATGAIPTQVRGVHHFSLAVTSFESGHRYYGELLGLPRVSSEGFGRSMVVFYQFPTGEQLHLHLGGPSTHTHIAIDVDDFSAVVGRLRAGGVTVREPGHRPDGSDFVFTQDFDGNTVELTSHRSWRPARVVSNG